MKPSSCTADLSIPATLPDAHGYAPTLVALLLSMQLACDVESAVAVFRQTMRLIGADSGVFLSVIRDDASRRSYRSLFACDPLWAIEYSRAGWHDNDPWLRYALFRDEPIPSSELKLLPSEDDFIQKSSRLGFASALIAPAPSFAGTSRIGVLVLGSAHHGFFDGEGYRSARFAARALAMELHNWLMRAIRADLLERSRIKPDEIELLRNEEAGLSSKLIAARLDVTPKTVERRFERVIAKLGVADRRSAARIARLYELL